MTCECRLKLTIVDWILASLHAPKGETWCDVCKKRKLWKKGEGI